VAVKTQPGISPSPRLSSVLTPTRLMERVIPDRPNRSLWWLTVGLGYSVVMVGPLVSSVVLSAIFDITVVAALLWLWPLNLIAMSIALALGAWLLHFVRQSLDSTRAILFVTGITLTGVIIRFILLRLSPNPPVQDAGPTFYVIQLAIGLILLAANIAAVSYAASRERALSDAFAQLARAQVRLAQEEEQVRGEVFDHLHGSLQAEFVAMRQSLGDLSRETNDPVAARRASEAEVALARIYRDGIESVNRALYPPGLEAGIIVALRELATRVESAASVDVQADPIIVVMDDPMTGGIHRSLRMAAYRVAEEAVSNAIEHSRACSIRIVVTSRLDSGSAALDLTVSHQSPDEIIVREGSGLARMRSRAEALGGSVDYVWKDGTFTVHAWLPMVRPDGGRWVDAEAGLG